MRVVSARRARLHEAGDNVLELAGDLVVELARLGEELDLVEVELDIGKLDEESAARVGHVLGTVRVVSG